MQIILRPRCPFVGGRGEQEVREVGVEAEVPAVEGEEAGQPQAQFRPDSLPQTPIPPPPPTPAPNNSPACNSPPAGNIARYLDKWKQITQSNFILQIIEFGYKLQFNSPPFQQSPIITNVSKSNLAKLPPLISDLENSGAISRVNASESLHLYRAFSVLKKNGKGRFIIDLSPLNRLIKKVHFRMEDAQFIKSLVNPNDYLASIDLSDAFLSIPLHHESKKFISFHFNGTTFSFNVLPFGLTSSPRIFSKVLRPVISHLRRSGIKVSAYLDDIILCSPDFNSLLSHVDATISLLTDLGFTINRDKSSLIPSQSLIHLGYLWDTVKFSLSIPSDKISKVKLFASYILSHPVSIRDISSFLGIVVSMTIAFPFSPIHYRGLQACFLSHRRQSDCWEDAFYPDDEAISDLQWWSLCPSTLPSASLFPFVHDLTLTTDASSSGWGASLSNGLSASGSWSQLDLDHINFLELKAIYNGIMSLLPHIKNHSLKILTDNISCVFYLNKMGGTHSKSMCDLSLKIWRLLFENHISCKAFHIAGISNKFADKLSRNSLHSELQISHLAFEKISALTPFPLKIDLFASRFSRKIPCFVSRTFDPLAWETDAFSFRWPEFLYIFPPINLIHKILEKFKSDNVQHGLLLTPAWQSLSCLPVILELLCSHPIFIPSIFVEGTFPTRRPFNLLAWPISSSFAKRRDFQTQPHLLSSKVSLLNPSIFTPDYTKNFTFGYQNNKILILSVSP